MPKINLLRNRTKNKLPEGMVYVITQQKNKVTYFVCRKEPQSNAVVWTSQKDKAMTFHTKSGSQMFVDVQLNGRGDVEIVGVIGRVT